ncbi:SulP family inorganic anion transporter [Nonlabens ponticola]|uniref:SulP family inorganic anion transporter n=1 Tax=Nonlabens ponticola TaxID=2496866 RepID=A0A3S9MV57_9FLAO|nr:SulP family inorganic anion transporter [Nonlabens ponticola]AZQ43066.1 SulP family inorganic anion transporter [Nonlabens ponticola]
MTFTFKHIKGDLFGGLTAGIVALPLALAFGVQSGMGAVAGLYGAIFIGFFASLFGGTNTQISGPTAPMTAVSMVIIAGIIQTNEGSLENALPAILAVFLMAGIMQIALGAMKLGKYIKYIPYPVVSGFMTGIGVIILITQILPAIGYIPSQDEEFVKTFEPAAQELILNGILEEEVADDVLVLQDFEQSIVKAQNITQEQINKEATALAKSASSGVVGSIKTMPRAFQNIDFTELIIALITIVVIFGFKKITTSIPSTLVALLGVTLGVFLLDIDARKLGEIPTGLPIPNLEIITGFSFGAVSPYIFTALTLALLGAIDSLLTSVVADNMTKTRHNPNQELVGQGIGNSIASIFGGIPGAGATIRTVVNIDSGGKTKLSGMIAAVLLLIIVVALGGFASEIPSAVLAGILITVGIGVMDYKGLKALRSIPKSDVVIMFVVLTLTVTWDLVYAVGIGLVIASLIFMKKMGDANAAKSQVKTLSRKDDYGDEDYSLIPLDLREEVFIKEIDGPLFFGSTKDFQAMSQNIPSKATHVIIRMEKVPFMDQSGLFAFEDVAQYLVQQGVTPLISGLKEQPRYRLEAIDIIPDLIKEEHLFESYTQCVSWVEQNVEDTVAPEEV